MSWSASLLSPKEQLAHPIAAGRLAYLHPATGTVCLNGVELESGDARKIQAEEAHVLMANEGSELLLFYLG